MEKLVDIKSLKLAKYNPKHRTEKIKLKSLCASLTQIGQLSAVVVDENNNVIDGHRRIAAAKLLKWKEILVATRKLNCTTAEAFASVNKEGMKISQADLLQIWLKSPEAVTPQFFAKITNLVEIYGIDYVKKIAKENYSPHIFSLAKRVAVYCEKDTVDFTKKVLDYILKWKSQGRLKSYMQLSQSPASLYKVVVANRELKPTWS